MHWLKLGELEWVTVPDPFEDQWHFVERYPGKRYLIPAWNLDKILRPLCGNIVLPAEF